MNNNRNETLPEPVIQALRSGKKIEAIKLLRESTGMGLKDSKEAVERYIGDYPEQIPQRSSTGSSGLKDLLKVAAVLLVAYLAYRLLS